MDEILTVTEVAEYLKMAKAKVYYLLQRNEIPHYRIGRNVRVRKSDLDIWMEANYQPFEESIIERLNDIFNQILSGKQ